MIERKLSIGATYEKIGEYAAILASWDTRITEIAAYGDIRTKIDNGEKIDLICTFEPEPNSDHFGYISVFNLALRDDHEGISEKLGISFQLDLGFKLGGKILLPNGEIMNDPGHHFVLWKSMIDEQK